MSQQVAMERDAVGAPGRGIIDQTIEYKVSRLTRFGLTLAASSYEHIIEYLMVGRNDVGTIAPASGDPSHMTHLMIKKMMAVIDKLEDDTLTFTVTYMEYALFRLGRICRRMYQGYNLALQLSQTELTAWFGASWDDWFQDMWWAIGSDLGKMFGMWSRLTNRRIDDLQVGIMICARHVSEDMSLWYYSQGDIINRCVEWKTGDHMGEYIPFNRKLRKTWDSVLFELELLGLDPDLVNDPDVRKFTVPLLKGSGKRAARLLSRSKIYWKFGREKVIVPVYTISQPTNEASNIYTDFNHETDYKWRLHASTTANFNTKRLTADYKELVTMIESMWLDRRAMIPQKSMWEKRLLSELTIPEGNGGLLWAQFTNYIHDGGARDSINTISATPAVNTLMNVEERHAEDTDDAQNYFFQIIGDNMPIEDYRLFYARCASYINGEAIVSTYLRPFGWFWFGIKKTEHREEMDETALLSCENLDDSYALTHWRYDASPTDGVGNTIVCKLDTQNRSARFTERSFDYFKKLEHWEHDIKHLDIDLVQQEYADYMTDDAEGLIASSAPAEKDDKKEKEKKKKEENKEKAVEQKKKADEKKKKEKDAKKKKNKTASSAVSNVNNRIMDNNDDGLADVADNPQPTLDVASGAPTKKLEEDEEAIEDE